uniref:Transmembrane protein 154 n=1 Tax=Salvator merianae TaxID=96440 RepID=A0A8D0B269_SALMN
MTDNEYSGNGTPVSAVAATTGLSTSISFLTTSNQDVEATFTMTQTQNSEGGTSGTTEESEVEGLHSALMFGVPAALLLVLSLLLVTFLVRRRKQKQTKQEELGSENCKSPIFEEDTPSVMEIEMEELDKWMNSLKRNDECDYLPPLKEEKDGNANPRLCY